MTTCFAYARVSTGEQAKGFSLQAQFSEIDCFSEERSITILDRFSDSMSGTKLTERHGLMMMLDRISDAKPHYIIATETDRISRNALQFGWIDTHLSMKGAQLLLVNERHDTDPAGKAFQKIRIVFSEFENDLRQWRINRGRALAIKEKRFMNRPPFGYGMRGGKLVINPDEVVVIRDVFRQYGEGISIKRIARQYRKAPSNIRYMLNNRFFMDPDLHGKHEPVIDAETFQAAQRALEQSRLLYHSPVIPDRNL